MGTAQCCLRIDCLIALFGLGSGTTGVTAASNSKPAAIGHIQKSEEQFTHDFDRLMNRIKARFPEVPSIAWTVTRSDHALSQGAWGWVDVDKHIPVTRDTPYYIASSGKSFVALATEVLASRG